MDCDFCGESAEAITTNVSLCKKCQNSRRGEEIEFQTDLYQLLEQIDTRKTLVQLYAFYYISQFILQDERIEADSAGAPVGLIFHGIGLLWSFEENQSRQTDFRAVVEELHNIFNEYMNTGLDRLGGQSVSEHEAVLRNRDLICGRFAHPLQERRVAEERYRRFSAELKRSVGFDIDDCFAFDDKLLEIYSRGVNKMGRIFHQNYYPEEEFGDLTSSIWLNKDLMLEKIVPHVNQVSAEIYDDFWLDGQELFHQVNKSDWEEFHCFLDRMSAPIGSEPGVGIGPDIVGYDKPYRCPYDVNPMEQHLFAESKGEYLAPILGIHYSTFSETFYYDILNSGINVGRFSNDWGDYVEEIIANDLRLKYSDSANVLKNPNYNDPTQPENQNLAETDIVLETENFFLVFECKVYPLRAETRSGYSSLPSIREQVKEGVGKGYKQALRLIHGIQEGKVQNLILSDETDFQLNKEYQQFIPIIVMGSHYSELATGYFFDLLDSVETTPFVVDLYDIEMIVHASELVDLVRYIETRRYIIQQSIPIQNTDELDYYWAFENGLFQPKILSIIQTHQFEFAGRSLTTNIGSILSRYGYNQKDIREKLTERGLTDHIFLSFDDQGYINRLHLPPHGGEIRSRVISSELGLDSIDNDLVEN